MADDGDMPRQELVAIEDDIGAPALPMNRHYLWALIFSGEEDMEQFITEFGDVAAICRWPARVTLIQLRLCLATVVKRLAQVAYGDLPAHGRQSLALDAFLQSNNNLGLKQHLLVAEVETKERVSGLDMPISKPTVRAGLGQQCNKSRPTTTCRRRCRRPRRLHMSPRRQSMSRLA